MLIAYCLLPQEKLFRDMFSNFHGLNIPHSLKLFEAVQFLSDTYFNLYFFYIFHMDVDANNIL